VTIRVLLCDDQALVRSGFRMILDAREDIEVVGEAQDGAQAIVLALRRRPDVILMDVRMPRLDGVEATRRLVTGGADRDPHHVRPRRVRLRGAAGRGQRVPAQGRRARSAGGGDPRGGARRGLLAPTVTRRLLDRFARVLPGAAPQPPPELSELTEREREVLALLGTGLSNAELAERLFLSETTVKTHVSSILRKLDLRDRVQAVVLAHQAGLVPPRAPR
jgi:DNA-binding NarL/FixJ family response regulator